MIKRIPLFITFLLVVLMLQACSLSELTGQEAVPIPITGNEAEAEVQEPAVEAMEAPEPEAEIVEQEVVEEQVQVEEEIVEQEVVRPAPVHSLIPGNLILIDVQTVSDCRSGGSRVEGEPIIVGTGCDIWQNNFIERPFDPTRVDYNPNVDIVQQALGYDDDFFYARMTLFQDDLIASDLIHTYGIEIDLDVDQDGDLLIFAVNPQQFAVGEWHAEQVFIFVDQDDDVGGLVPVYADDQPYEGNGYEFLLFESGYGDDADAAWARVSAEKPNAVEFAFKSYLLEEPISFQWWMWALEGEMMVETFDYVDRFSAEDRYYLDNTCRWLFGAPPNANLINVCPIWTPPPTPGPGPEEPPPQIPGRPNDPN